MGSFPPSQIPEKMRRMMSAKDRAPSGKLLQTQPEADAKHRKREEIKLQGQCIDLLNQRGLFFIYQRPDRPASARKGQPDFIVFGPATGPMESMAACRFIEIKWPGEKCSEDQLDWHRNCLEKTGAVVYVAFSLKEFRDLIDDL